MTKTLGALGDRLVSLLVPDLPVFASQCCDQVFKVSVCRNGVKLVTTCYMTCGCGVRTCVGPNYGGSC